MLTDQEKQDLIDAGEDYARDNQDLGLNDLEGCARDLAAGSVEDETLLDVAADYIYEGMVKTRARELAEEAKGY